MIYAYKMALVYTLVIIHTVYVMGIILVHCAHTGIEVHRIVVDGGRKRKGGTGIEASTHKNITFLYQIAQRLLARSPHCLLYVKVFSAALIISCLISSLFLHLWRNSYT